MATASFDYNNYYKVKSPTGYDIYNAGTNQKYTYEQLLPSFQSGLNADFIREVSQPGNMSTPQTGTTPTPTGGTTSSMQDDVLRRTSPNQPVQMTTGTAGSTPTASTERQIYPEPPATYTPPQFTNNNNQVYKEWNQETGTWDVFDSSGKSIDLATFKNMGLNIDHINTMNQIQQRGDMSNQPGVQEQPEEPPSNFADDYKKNLDASGAASIKSQAEDYIKQLGELQNELNDQIAEVNDNPWLAEGVRDAKVKKLQERYEGKIKILTSQAALFNNLYEQAIAEAKFITTGEQADRNKMMELAQEQQQLEFNMWKELNKDADMQITEIDGGRYIVNRQTGEKVYLGKAGTGKTSDNLFTKAEDTLQQYKDRGYSRAEVEEEWKKQNAASGQDWEDVELPLTIKSALDAIYGPEPIPQEQLSTNYKDYLPWYNPFSWF